jgi:hypothetical protein
MNRPYRPTRLLAIAAAYVIALQALLLPLSVAAGSPFIASLCAASASTDGAPAPASHNPSGCPCAAGCGMHCHFHALATPVQTPVSVHRAETGTPTALRLNAPILQTDASWHQFARGPPAA